MQLCPGSGKQQSCAQRSLWWAEAAADVLVSGPEVRMYLVGVLHLHQRLLPRAGTCLASVSCWEDKYLCACRSGWAAAGSAAVRAVPELSSWLQCLWVPRCAAVSLEPGAG